MRSVRTTAGPGCDRLDQVPPDMGKATTALRILQPVVTFVSVYHKVVSVFDILQEILGMFPGPGGRVVIEDDKCSGCYGYVVRYGLNKDMSDANVVTVKGENTLSRTFSG